jgi:hypothetical protein
VSEIDNSISPILLTNSQQHAKRGSD